MDKMIPDTYPEFFHRTIRKCSYYDLANISFPYFIKSTRNDKQLNGIVAYNSMDLNELWLSNNIVPDDELYVADVVNF